MISREQCIFLEKELIVLYELKCLLNIIITCHISMDNFLNPGSLSTLAYSVLEEKFPISLCWAYQNHTEWAKGGPQMLNM